MSKRQRQDDAEELPQKKVRKGFSVGPANLPDGTYRRKTQKIKNDLIENAKVKKAYAKIKAQEGSHENGNTNYNPYVDTEEEQQIQENVEHTNNDTPHESDIHPQRQAMLEEPETQENTEHGDHYRPRDHRITKRRDRSNRKQTGTGNEGFSSIRRHPVRYRKEFAEAKDREKLVETKQKRRELREKDRRAMIKAKKPGKDGRQKLGRQGTVLLGRVQRMIEERKMR